MDERQRERVVRILAAAANEHGEQAVFDRECGEATLRLGDAGWARTHRVVDGDVPGLVLTASESTWLRACWLASGARRS